MPNETSTPKVQNATKLCHIVKRLDFEGYGFNLHSEKIKPGQYIGKVDAGSPAEESGLKEGDRILEVNGVPINGETHKQVVQRIKAIACEVRLLIIDEQKANESETDNENYCKKEIESINKNNKSPLTQNFNNNESTSKGTIQEMPGYSANISSISVVSTKRETHNSNNNNGGANTIITSTNNADIDTVDKGINENENNYEMSQKISRKNIPYQHVTKDNSNKTSGLQLPTTAAEMRAQILSRKKYDPKNESLDLKKKFEIIQKL